MDISVQTSHCPFYSSISPATERFIDCSDYLQTYARALEPLNAPHADRVREFQERLEGIAQRWSLKDQVTSNDLEYTFIMESWNRMRVVLKAISATDFLIGWDNDSFLVERPGQRIESRRREISGVAEQVELGDDVFDWTRVTNADRIALARLMLLALKGSPMESVNRVRRNSDILTIAATELARLEKIGGEKIFEGTDQDFLGAIRCFSQLEQQILERCGLTKVVLVEGVRSTMYSPVQFAEPDSKTMARIAQRFGLSPSDADSAEERAGEVIDRMGLKNALFEILVDVWQYLSDEAIIIHRPHMGPFSSGDKIYSWFIVGGRCFTYEGEIQDSSVLSVETPRLYGKLGEIVPQSWRRSQELVGEYPQGIAQKVIDLRRDVMTAEGISDEVLADSPKLLKAVQDAARYLGRRLINHNLEAAINGTQLGTTALQPGWSLSFDQSPDGTGYGTLNNPAHAMGGVQTMIRAPASGTLFSQIRIWRERGDDGAQYTLQEIPIFNAYRHWIDSLLRASRT